jgi:predicted amidophosphoribosyltransferase
MPEERCPHCGDKLPLARDAFCATCAERLDEPPERPRTPEEQRAFRARVEQEAREGLRALGWLSRLFPWF